MLFRGNSVLTKALDAYMKVCGMDYLHATLGPVLRDICENRVYCELDPTRLTDKDDLHVQIKRTTQYAEQIW